MCYKYHRLDNGIRIIHKDVKSPVAHCGIFINTGARDEEPHEHGIAHFIEHVIFKGTKTRKAFHVLSRLDNVGGDLNAYTTKEETCIYASFLTQYYDRTLELFSDISLNSVFPKKELEKEKDVITDEINSYLDSPSELIFDEFEEMIFEGHALGRDILGKPELIESFSKNHILRFISKNYHTEGMIIASVGSIDFKDLVKRVEKYFGHLPQTSKARKRKKFVDYKAQDKIVKKDTYQTHIIMGNMAYSFTDKKKNGLFLLNNLLGGPALNSRLNLSIREKYGFTYHVESNYQPYSDTGHFHIYMGTDQGARDKAINLVYKELKKLKDAKLGTLQLQRAKKQLIGQMAISFESNLNEMLSIGKSHLYHDEVESLHSINNKIEALSATELFETANEIFDEKGFSILTYKSGKNGRDHS